MRMRAVLALLGVSVTSLGRAAPAPITIALDASDAARAVLHARLMIPASAGPLTLVYPKWLPGTHGPTGVITNLVNLKFSAAGKSIPWQRDSVDLYAFHLQVPPGADRVEAALDFLPTDPSHPFSSSANTPHLLALAWNQVLLYPLGAATDSVSIAASLRLPAGWRYRSALGSTLRPDGEIRFATTSLTTLVDSPVLAGEYYKVVALDDSARPVELDIAADSVAALDIKPDTVDHLKRLVAETDSLFGARHYDRYHFLLTLSDHVAHYGLEHHQSTDVRLPERTFVDEVQTMLNLTLLAHEFVHSWNGKYRRPAGLATADFQAPMRGDMLWVYEGLTQYLGYILTPRSGLTTAQRFRDKLANVAAYYDSEPGRSWRSLLDTAIAAQDLDHAPGQWGGLRRGTDYYSESVLIWLEADSLIRERSADRRSLDDFCRSFFGGESGAPRVVPYTFDELIAALNGVEPYDWRAFFNTRLISTDAHAPLGGIQRDGWRLVLDDKPNEYLKDVQASEPPSVAAGYSLGLWMDADGTIRDAFPGRPAHQAGMGPGMKIVAVNGRRWSPTVFRDALAATPKAAGPLALLVENIEFFTTYNIAYHGGPREPHLERDETRPDWLSRVIAPRSVN